jgi:hypothetical protein
MGAAWVIASSRGKECSNCSTAKKQVSNYAEQVRIPNGLQYGSNPYSRSGPRSAKNQSIAPSSELARWYHS